MNISMSATGNAPDPFAEIHMLTLHATRGANYWSRHPVTRLDLNIGAYEDLSSADLPHVTDQLVATLPGLWEHQCSVGTPGGFVQRLRSGTYAAHIVEHVALELQSMIGHDVGYGRTRGTGTVGEYTLVFEHVHEGVGLRAAALALDTVQRALAGTLETVEHAVAELRALAATPVPPPSRQRVLCGITGGTGRNETREALRACGVGGITGGDELVIDVAPGYILHAGLPYAHSDIAVILDTAPTDVPDRYRDPERAAQLVAVVADAVPRHGIVVCPADAHYVHDLIRDAGRRLIKFVPSDDIAERARRAADAAAVCITTTTAMTTTDPTSDVPRSA